MREAYTVTPLSPMRRAIATRMSESKRTIPHFRLVTDIQIDELRAQRQELLQRRPDHHLSLNDLLIKACAQALTDIPEVNVQWAEKELHCFHTADSLFQFGFGHPSRRFSFAVFGFSPQGPPSTRRGRLHCKSQ